MAGFVAPEEQGGIRAHRRPDPARLAIRRAHASELDDVAALFEPALAVYRGTDDDWMLDSYLADLVKVEERFGIAETLVAVECGRVLGSVAFYRDVALEGWSNLPPGWSGFRALAVHPEARGRGAGRLLVERCIERTREVGAPTLGIHTIALLEDAKRLYERVGFVRCPEFDLRARDVFAAPPGKDMRGLAFRYDVGRIGPRTVIEPGSTA